MDQRKNRIVWHHSDHIGMADSNAGMKIGVNISFGINVFIVF